RVLLHEFMDDRFTAYPDIDAEETNQGGARLLCEREGLTYKFGNLFPRTSLQMRHRGSHAPKVAPWIHRGPEYYDIYFRRAPTQDELLEQMNALFDFGHEIATG